MRRLYDRYADYAMAVGLRYIPERDAVRDVLQDSFVKILTSVGQMVYRGEGSLKCWVAKIVSHRAIGWIKEHEQLLLSDQMPDEIEEDEEAVIEDIPKNLLNEMIGRLPLRYRVVINLRAFEELSHKEIALRLGINENTSVTLFSRAKRKLEKMMKEYLNSQRI